MVFLLTSSLGWFLLVGTTCGLNSENSLIWGPFSRLVFIWSGEFPTLGQSFVESRINLDRNQIDGNTSFNERPHPIV